MKETKSSDFKFDFCPDMVVDVEDVYPILQKYPDALQLFLVATLDEDRVITLEDENGQYYDGILQSLTENETYAKEFRNAVETGTVHLVIPEVGDNKKPLVMNIS